MTDNIVIVPGKGWNKVPPRSRSQTHVPRKITIHHQGGSGNNSLVKQLDSFNGAKTVRAIQHFHMDTRNGRGWIDIGYHFLIDPDGIIYQGRDSDVVGAHVKNNNTGNIGIMMAGNFMVEYPTDAQLKSLKELIVHLGTIYPTINLPEAIYGHKDFMNTDCPGKNFYSYVRDLKLGVISLYD